MRWIDFENKKPTDSFTGWKPWTDAKWQTWLTTSGTLLASTASLNEEAQNLHASGDEAGAIEKHKERNAFIDGNGSHWGKLKPWLLALSHGKCWFSESKDVFSHYDVEHFRPKKIARDMGDDTRDGYWWLAYEYSNFRICGNVGNRKKGGWFPLQGGSLCSSYENPCEESESRYLLDPTDPSDVELIAFDEKGDAIAAPNVTGWPAERVKISVERLKLNEHEPLTDARKAVWQKVSREIEGYLSAKARCRNGGNPAAAEKLRGHIRNIREMTKEDQPLSSVANWCLVFRNDKQLLRLVA